MIHMRRQKMRDVVVVFAAAAGRCGDGIQFVTFQAL